MNTINNTNEGYSIAGMFDSGPFYATAAYQSNSNGPARLIHPGTPMHGKLLLVIPLTNSRSTVFMKK